MLKANSVNGIGNYEQARQFTHITSPGGSLIHTNYYNLDRKLKHFVGLFLI